MGNENLEEEIKMVEIRHCPRCKGSGETQFYGARKAFCEHCDGTGHIITLRS